VNPIRRIKTPITKVFSTWSRLENIELIIPAVLDKSISGITLAILFLFLKVVALIKII
jgi:hypothetical protein